MKLRTLIIDDEPIALEKLQSYVNKTPFLQLVGTCRNGIEASALMSQESIDVIFTDINMPDMNGMEFISSLTSQPLVIFITAYADYAVDSYRLSAVDYILKPYGLSEFQKSANKALEQYKLRFKTDSSLPSVSNTANPANSLFIKVDYRYIRVNLPDIRYIKGYGEYLQIYTKDSQTPILTLSSFSAIKEKLPSNFIHVHRSYIVNIDTIQSINKNRIIMDEDTAIPIGDSYKEALISYITQLSIGVPVKK